MLTRWVHFNIMIVKVVKVLLEEKYNDKLRSIFKKYRRSISTFK